MSKTTDEHAAIAAEADRRAREAMPADGDLADRVAGLLSYRPGVPTFPKELPEVTRALNAAGIGYENLRYLWTGAFNLHRLVEKEREEKAKIAVLASESSRREGLAVGKLEASENVAILEDWRRSRDELAAQVVAISAERDRLKAALSEIAVGTADPASLAADALEGRP